MTPSILHPSAAKRDGRRPRTARRGSGNRGRQFGVTAGVRLFVKLALIGTVAFLAAFQVRYSIETIEARDTFLYIPFRLKPGTNIVDRVDHPSSDVLHRGDTLLAVNQRPFTGASIYHQELRSDERFHRKVRQLPDMAGMKALENRPFRVTVRGANGDVRTVDVRFAHCTCGSPSATKVIWYAIVPPAFCLIVGLVVVAMRPMAGVSWLFLAVAICLSLANIVPGNFANWSQEADPMEWQDWFRVPAIAYQTFFSASWPAWLLLFGAHALRREDPARTPWWAVAPTLALSTLKTIATVGWSEDFQRVEPLLRWLESVSTPAAAFALLSLTAVIWRFSRVWQAAAAVLTLAAVAVLYRPTWPLLLFVTPVFPYDGSGFPYIFWTTTVVSAVFAALVFLLVIARGRAPREIPAIAFLALLPVPLLYAASSTVWGVWWMGKLPELTLAALYLGLLASAWLLRDVVRPPHRLDSTTNVTGPSFASATDIDA